jgi:sulfite reductase (NADPH) flavoprotein alpha-component
MSKAMSADPILSLVPLPEEKATLLARLVDGLDQATLNWLSGYAAGLATRPHSNDRDATTLVAVDAAPQVTILFGSQTGNSKRLAENLSRQIENAGFAFRLIRADNYPLRELKSEKFLFVVISTQGEGDPPDDSRGFVEFLASKRAPQLGELKFAVLGLGDSSYAKFCAVGSQIDARLAELGAKRLFARGDADVDIETVATPWLQSAISIARDQLKSTTTQRSTVIPLRGARAPVVWNRERPFAAEVLANQRISAGDGTKDIRHIELSLRDSGLSYEPGDALGVWPSNPPELIAKILDVLKLDGQAGVEHDGQTLPLHDWLIDKREVTRLSRPFVVAHAERAKNNELDAIINSSQLQPLLADYQVIDVLHKYRGDWDATSLVAALRPLTPRLYSIASSLKFAEDEAHLTVARIDYAAFGRDHVGAASHFLATRNEEAKLPIYIEANDRFRLPTDPSRDVIMIGPGTGVAPFRAFVQERAAIGAKGRNWLFFGNPHLRTDFLYQVEWQAALKRGELHKIDLAFSRDQSNKVYVQHNIRRSGKALFDWLQGGAHLYVCGDATAMAKDVHSALRDVVVQHGGKNIEDAEAYLSQLANDRRYSRDVY